MAVSGAVAIDAEVLAALGRQAQLRGVSVEALANLWRQQKLRERGELAVA